MLETHKAAMPHRPAIFWRQPPYLERLHHFRLLDPQLFAASLHFLGSCPIFGCCFNEPKPCNSPGASKASHHPSSNFPLFLRVRSHFDTLQDPTPTQQLHKMAPAQPELKKVRFMLSNHHSLLPRDFTWQACLFGMMYTRWEKAPHQTILMFCTVPRQAPVCPAEWKPQGHRCSPRL